MRRTTPNLEKVIVIHIARRFLMVALLAATAVSLVPATASADGNFNCRASGARAITFGTPPLATVEPVRANAVGLPCSTQSAETVHPTTIINLITADAVRAYTTLRTTPPAAASSEAIVSTPKIGLTGLNITIDAVTSQASATCDANDNVVLAGSSKVVNLRINGSLIAIPSGDQPFKLSLGALGTLTLNEQVKSGESLIQRAVHLDSPLVDLVLAESIAGSQGGNPCTGLIPPGGPNACPPGARYDVTRNLCVLDIPGTTRVVVIGPPYSGPSGGRVVLLTTALKKYHSPCLHGPGPKYAVIGTNRNDHITGTNHSDRILGLGGLDSIDGGRGNDCLDGGAARDNLNGAIGKDRVYGMSGNDSLNGGPGTDYLSGGSGNDSINAAFGADRILGGSGNDHINVATAGPSAHVNCGSGFDKLRGNRGEDRLSRHCEVIFITKKVKG